MLKGSALLCLIDFHRELLQHIFSHLKHFWHWDLFFWHLKDWHKLCYYIWVFSRPWNVLCLFICKHSERRPFHFFPHPAPGQLPFQILGHTGLAIPASGLHSSTIPASVKIKGLLSKGEDFQSFSPSILSTMHHLSVRLSVKFFFSYSISI